MLNALPAYTPNIQTKVYARGRPKLNKTKYDIKKENLPLDVLYQLEQVVSTECHRSTNECIQNEFQNMRSTESYYVHLIPI